MTGVTGVHHVALSVPDMDVARRFYIDLLGAQEISSSSWEPGNDFVEDIIGLRDCKGSQLLLRLKNTYVELFEFSQPRAAPQDPDEPVNRFGYTHFGIEVDDIHAIYERMLAAGIRFHCAPKHVGDAVERDGKRIGFWSTYGRDFFGNVFELMEINEGSITPGL